MKSFIFKTQHNPLTTILVTYRVDAKDFSKGFDITVGADLWARVFNPSDVTRWFVRNSKVNIENWKKAYHTSGLVGTDFLRPQPNDVVLDVPYYSQRDNERYPSGTCNVTSYAMPMAYFGVPRRKVNGKMWAQREDELEAFLQANKKDRHNHEDLAWMGRQYGLDCRFGVDRTWDEIFDELRAGNPVVVSGTFTSAGHIIAIIGFKPNKDLIVNDPFGDALTHYRSRNGAGLVYPFDYMQKTVKDARDSKWAHFMRKK